MALVSNTLFIVGAGFTRAAFPQAPLNRDLCAALIEAGSATLAKHRARTAADDIETLLTMMDIEASRGAAVRPDRRQINRDLAAFFSRFRASALLPNLPDWLRAFGTDVVRPGDAIVSLNYDCLLEGALDILEIWTPRGGYGRITNPVADTISANPGGIVVYKIHGSENFTESGVFPPTNPRRTSIGVEINAARFPVSGAHMHIYGGMIDPRPYVIAPSFVKAPHVEIAALMIDALRAAESTRHLAVIGCGMRPEDSFLWLLLTQFVTRVRDERGGLILVGPNAAALSDRIEEYWGRGLPDWLEVAAIEQGVQDSIGSLVRLVR